MSRITFIPSHGQQLCKSSSTSPISNEEPNCLDSETSNCLPVLVEAAACLLDSDQVKTNVIMCIFENRIDILQFPDKTLRILPWGAHRAHVDLATSLYDKFCVPDQDVVKSCCKGCESFRQMKRKSYCLEVDFDNRSFTALITRTQCVNACAATVKAIVKEINASEGLVVGLWEPVYIPGLREELSAHGCQTFPLDINPIL